MIRIIVTVLMVLMLSGWCISAEATKMGVPPYSITFEWAPPEGEDIGKVDGYRIYFGETSRYDPSLTAGITEHIEVEMCKGSQTCIDTWDNYCEWMLRDEETRPFGDLRLCDADYYTYDFSTDLGLVYGATIGDLSPGTWYFTIVAYDNEATYAFYASQPPECVFSVELEHTFLVAKPVNSCQGDLDGDGDVDGTDLSRIVVLSYLSDFGRTDCLN